jgi:hypothetical protein
VGQKNGKWIEQKWQRKLDSLLGILTLDLLGSPGRVLQHGRLSSPYIALGGRDRLMQLHTFVRWSVDFQTCFSGTL